MIEGDQLREEQQQEFYKEDKEKSKESKSDRNRVIEDHKLGEGAAQVCVKAPKKTSNQFGAKGSKKKKSRPRKDITCYFCKMVGQIQKNCPFKLMIGVRTNASPEFDLITIA